MVDPWKAFTRKYTWYDGWSETQLVYLDLLQSRGLPPPIRGRTGPVAMLATTVVNDHPGCTAAELTGTVRGLVTQFDVDPGPFKEFKMGKRGYSHLTSPYYSKTLDVYYRRWKGPKVFLYEVLDRSDRVIRSVPDPYYGYMYPRKMRVTNHLGEGETPPEGEIAPRTTKLRSVFLPTFRFFLDDPKLEDHIQ